MPTTVPRSFLYVPANRPDLFDKAHAGPADAIILDLEDAVPLAEKSAARSAVTDWLGGLAPSARHSQRWVRVDTAAIVDDLEAVVTEQLDGIIVAKCTAASLEKATDLITHLEAGHAPVPVIGLIESGTGLMDLTQMAAHPRLATFGIGETDLLGDLRIARTDSTAAVIDLLRMQVVIACAAAGIAAPVAPTSTSFRDLEAFRRTTAHLKDLGFRARTAIHPGQIPVIHEILTPTPKAVAEAQDVLDRFAAAHGGVTTDVDGNLIDAAVVRAARETMSLRDAADQRST